ncbi:MAG: DNA repair protein RadC [Elusimicrobia bacterium]|nr:DNA repair protein RadC [Elusimicrobiota bacterium]
MTPATAERPREKLARRGPEALSDAELIALVLRTGAPGRPAVSVAEELLRRLPEGAASGFERLRRVPGIGPARAAALSAAAELGRRGRTLDPRAVIDGARAAAGAVPGEVRGAGKEHFLVLCLNARRQLLRIETVSVGTLSASLVHPREVFAPAISHGAAAIVAVHNHPSGDTSPSAEDREVTRRLQRGGDLLGIPLADHVIVSESSFFSFRESGIL